MSANNDMKYEELVELYEILDLTSKRLEKTSIIADFLSMVGEEIQISFQLLLYLH